MAKKRMDWERHRIRNRRKEKAKREEEKGETQVEHINIGEDTEEDYFSDIEKGLCEIYDRENEEEWKRREY